MHPASASASEEEVGHPDQQYNIQDANIVAAAVDEDMGLPEWEKMAVVVASGQEVMYLLNILN